MSDLTASLQRSAANRSAMLKRFGEVPLSILRIARGALSSRVFLYQREQPERHSAHGQKTKDKLARLHAAGYTKKITASQRKCGRGGGGASIMPAELVDFFVKYYAQPGDTYLDPFMGQGVQMQVAHLRGLHYRGYDISQEFFDYIEAVRERIDDHTTTLDITCGDSRHPDRIPDGCGDFSFHSPPYWDIEYYGDEPEQLGAQSYDDFIESMVDVYRAWLPKFKPGAFHVVNVNDFRKAGRFFAYHVDTMKALELAGWQIHDLWVIDGLVGGMSKAFAVDFNMKRIAPKVHEYAIVARAPGGVDDSDAKTRAEPREPARRWSVSAKWLSHKLRCSMPHIVETCEARRCKNQRFWPPRAGSNPTQCDLLGEHGCTLGDARPVTCHLYPAMLNKSNKLILYHRAQITSCKGNWHAGEMMAVDALMPSFRALFGDEIALRIQHHVHLGIDFSFDVPEHIAKALERERDLESRDEMPEAREQP